MNTFTPQTLVSAVRALFELNYYEVRESVQIHGAEVDLIATKQGDPFAPTVYVEVTIEHVDNDKYGKDVGKLALIREIVPDAQLLIVSSKGFSNPVSERAAHTRIKTMTYDELFRQFERFEGLVRSTLDGGLLAEELTRLESVYEEPDFKDTHGSDRASQYLTTWLDEHSSRGKWLIVVGEYGTGKTALTKALQRRWTQRYKNDPRNPIPFRIELRDFTRQFDARGLLHHFLDSHGLGHVPVDFALSLIRTGRVVLLLDGYDEMAQYMHARERRACLEALATLSSGGARGILTSRPNYFSEAEELQVFDVLYASFKSADLLVGKHQSEVVDKEREVDSLLQSQFLDRFERRLRDLSSDQTKSLVRRSLAANPQGADVVLSVLDRVFGAADGDERSLSGKPVIISYLLEVADSLSVSASTDADSSWSEWRLYDLVMAQLMLRDFRRSPLVVPERRRIFLRNLATTLSKRDTPTISESEFRDAVRREFRNEIRRTAIGSESDEIERFFSDLRSSATLTRVIVGGKDCWRFSHNSLREFLLADHLLQNLANKTIVPDRYPISDAMRAFVASQTLPEVNRLANTLATVWSERRSVRGVGQLLVLLWDAIVRRDPKRSPTEFLRSLGNGSQVVLDNVDMSQLVLSSESQPLDLKNALLHDSSFSDVSFSYASLGDANFSRSLLQGVKFLHADLRKADFRGAFLAEVEFTHANIQGADFRGIAFDDVAIVVEVTTGSFTRQRLVRGDALGYLSYHGATTDAVVSYYVYQFHPEFEIFDKIIRRLSEQGWCQVRGLVQRGPSRHNINFAEGLVQRLVRTGNVEISQRDLARLTPQGRVLVSSYLDERTLSADVVAFLDEWR